MGRRRAENIVTGLKGRERKQASESLSPTNFSWKRDESEKGDLPMRRGGEGDLPDQNKHVK